MIETPTDAPLFRFMHAAMACEFGLALHAHDEAYARHVARAVFDEWDRLESLLSRFIAHSDVSRINALRPGESLRVDHDTLACLQVAQRIQVETGGAFDVTFRSDSHPAEPPLVFDPDAHAVGVRMARFELDLGGIGKGYALDRAAALLADWEVTRALVHAGQSTVCVVGPPTGEDAWKIALRHPTQADRHIGHCGLRGAALAGSGQHLQGTHIVDPRTGEPGACTAAWAVAPSAAEADALSTAFMLMKPIDVEHFCTQRAGVSAILWPTAGDERPPLVFGVDPDAYQPAKANDNSPTD